MMYFDMKDLKSAEVQAMSNDDIKKIIADGKGKMSPVKPSPGPRRLTLSLTSAV